MTTYDREEIMRESVAKNVLQWLMTGVFVIFVAIYFGLPWIVAAIGGGSVLAALAKLEQEYRRRKAIFDSAGER